MTRITAPRLRTLVPLLLAAGLLLAGAGPAAAHAAPTGSDPRQGAVVSAAPTRITLSFSERVTLSDGSVRVLDPRGGPIQDGNAVGVTGATYAVKLRGGLPDGTYTVTYQVVSDDGHPVAGAYTFSIGAPSRTSVPVDGRAAGGGVVGVLYGVGRYASYAGFAVLAGGAAFVLACWRRGTTVRPVQRLVVTGWLTLTGATLALLLLRGSYTGSGKVGDVFDLDLLGQVLQTKTGAALVSRLLLLAAAALFVAVLFGTYDEREEEEQRDLAVGLAIGGSVVAAGLAASWAMSEHASAGLQPKIAVPVAIVHLLAVASWLGGLAALLVALCAAPPDTPVDARAVRRFSRVAFGSVLALVATGVYQSWRQLGSWSAFTGTRYGRLLLIKIGLVALLVGIAWLSRRWTARLAAAPAVPGGSGVSIAGSGTREDTGERGGGGGDGGVGVGVGVGVGREPAGARTGGAGAGTGAESGTGSGTGSGTDADVESVSASSTSSASAASAASAVLAGGGPERADQLARQRAAIDTARRERRRDADPSRSGLRRSVLAETGVAVVVLAVTTMLTSTEPGRTEEQAARASAPAAPADASAAGALTLDMAFDAGGANGKGVVRVDLDPARVGANELKVSVERPDGRALDVPELKVAFTLKSRDIGPLPVVPDRVSTGQWSASGVQLPVAGDWKVAVTVRTSDIDQATVSKNAQIG
ncbi:hypothetical protein SZN_06124 [Streptomyces zinciresistens K42]|uniref:Protein YobA n=1 Tax=Streptomyces zinciresistens K42 TaxID=700597 RepID=G2G6W7_9ACTN|nr:copper resistance protein CopC [Streptomyces zinciresistens]EGX60680.1 hypothetical protein SZN_06124 [Streptomyces zinciresistens K42]